MTLLPVNGSPWPPPEVQRPYRRMPLLSAWYSGDPDRLREAHGGGTAQIVGGPVSTSGVGAVVAKAAHAVVGRFWSSAPADGNEQQQRHLPTVEDIVRLSADLLYADEPTFIVDGPRHEEDGPEGADGRPAWRAGDPTPETTAAQQRLADVLDRCNWGAILHASHETGAALGWSSLRIAVDPRIPGRPILSRVDADGSVPILVWGVEVGTLFWRTVLTDASTIWRHVEAHEAGRVWHGLYEGTADDIGTRRPLATLSSLQALAQSLDGQESATLYLPQDAPADAATSVSIPNMLPDPLDRNANTGRSDLTPAVLDLADAADRAYSQMMQELEDAQNRLAVSEAATTRGALGGGLEFDRAQSIFLKLRTPPPSGENDGSNLPIELIQFQMRAEQYLTTIEALYAKAVHAAGYNAHALVDEEGQAITATEYAGRNRRSMTTRAKKIRYAQPALGRILTGLLATDVAKFQPAMVVDGTSIRVRAFPVRVEFPAAVQPTAIELAQTATALQASMASSIRTRVQAMHPEWTQQQVDDEVDAVREETNVADPMTFGVAGLGVGAGDGA